LGVQNFLFSQMIEGYRYCQTRELGEALKGVILQLGQEKHGKVPRRQNSSAVIITAVHLEGVVVQQQLSCLLHSIFL